MKSKRVSPPQAQPVPQQQPAPSRGPPARGDLGAVDTGVDTPWLSRMEAFFGVHPEVSQDEKASGVMGLTIGNTIHLSPSLEFGSREAEHTCAHEFAHVVQKSGGGDGEPSGCEGDLEAEAEAAAVGWFQGKRVALSSDAPSIPRPRRRARRPRERTAFQLTGHWAGDNGITLQINQAGRHLEGWWQRRKADHSGFEYGRLRGDVTSSDAQEVLFAYSGERHASQVCTQKSLGTEFSGTIRGTPGEKGVPAAVLTNATGGGVFSLRRISAQPRMAEPTIDAIGNTDLRAQARAHQDNPLNKEDATKITAFQATIQQRIQDYFDSASNTQFAKAAAIDKAIYDLRKEFPSAQEPLLIPALRQALQLRMSHNRVTRSVWDWLQIVVWAYPDWTSHLLFLGFKAKGSKDAKQNPFRFKLSVIGAAGKLGIGVSAFKGRMEVERGQDGSNKSGWKTSWNSPFDVVLFGVSAGYSGGLQTGFSTDWAHFETPFPWEKNNFLGWFNLNGVAAGASGVKGAQAASGFATFYGDGSFPALSIPVGGLRSVSGVFGGASVGTQIGRISGGSVDDEDRTTKQDSAEGVAKESLMKANTSAQFDINRADLKAGGLQSIRAFCALHLDALRSAASQLTIDGYASPSGGAAHNRRLSQRRAKATLAFIREVLGEDLKIPTTKISVNGHGEKPARDAGIRDGSESAEWRKVDIKLNGRVALRLQG